MWKEIKQESKGCNASPETSFPVSNNSTYVSSVGICCCFPLLGTVAHPKVSCMKFSPFRRDHWAAPANWRNIACSKLGIRQSHLAAKHSRNFKALVWTCLNLWLWTMDHGPWAALIPSLGKPWIYSVSSCCSLAPRSLGARPRPRGFTGMGMVERPVANAAPRPNPHLWTRAKCNSNGL